VCAFQSEQVVERAAAVAGFGVMVVVAPQLDFSKEGLDVPDAVAVTVFEGQWLFVVG